jgi:hypothetical protein
MTTYHTTTALGVANSRYQKWPHAHPVCLPSDKHTVLLVPHLFTVLGVKSAFSARGAPGCPCVRTLYSHCEHYQDPYQAFRQTRWVQEGTATDAIRVPWMQPRKLH